MFETILARAQRLLAFAKWESRWLRSLRASWLTRAPREFVTKGFDAGWLRPGMTALDIGCGEGDTAAWMAERGLDVVGIDFSPHAIRRARQRFPERPGLAFKVVDVCGRDQLAMTFDVLVDTGCLQGLPATLHADYKRSVLLWSRTGSRLVLPMHTLRIPPRERVAQVKALFAPEFQWVCQEETPSSRGIGPKPVIHLVRG
jgi:cyclopropane fatty-acyl-phospholipid synthase-like methyltransferase